jgi:putative peptidoglycan lipid II flippase
MTFLSRISGLLRDLIYAQVFGASAAMDAFVAVFRIPNFLRRLSAEGSFSMAFVPVLAQYKAAGDLQAVKVLVDRVAGVLIGALLVVTAAAIAASPWLISVVAPGFVPGSEQWQLAVDMLRITFPYALFISLAAMIMATLSRIGDSAGIAKRP